MRILIVEDEKNISDAVAAYIEHNNYEAVCAYDGEEALNLFNSENFDLLVLDLMLPKISGEEVCRKIREKNNTVPIIMLTARSSESDVVSGLDAGADDYVTKPFSPRVLMARIRAQLRPLDGVRKKQTANITCADGRIEIDSERVEIRKDGKPIQVTKSEFLIFSTLASRPIRTWTREEIIRSSFGDDYEGFDRTIDTYIKNLRKKLAEKGHENGWISTIHGFGYRIDS